MTLQTGRVIITVSIFLSFMTSQLQAQVSESDFFPFGSSHSDSLLPRGYPDGYGGGAGPVALSINFPFHSNTFNQLYVNHNGGIHFQTPYVGQITREFPQSSEGPVIMAFWSDVSVVNRGYIWYRETTDSAVLQRAQKEMGLASDDFSFSPDWAFVATWEDVGFYGASAIVGEWVLNTFQIALAFDSSTGKSYALFNYAKLNWYSGTSNGGHADTGLEGTPAAAGYDASDSSNYCTIPGSLTTDVRCKLTTATNVGVPGRYVFRLDTTTSLCYQFETVDCEEVTASVFAYIATIAVFIGIIAAVVFCAKKGYCCGQRPPATAPSTHHQPGTSNTNTAITVNNNIWVTPQPDQPPPYPGQPGPPPYPGVDPRQQQMSPNYNLPPVTTVINVSPAAAPKNTGKQGKQPKTNIWGVPKKERKPATGQNFNLFKLF